MCSKFQRHKFRFPCPLSFSVQSTVLFVRYKIGLLFGFILVRKRGEEERKMRLREKKENHSATLHLSFSAIESFLPGVFRSHFIVFFSNLVWLLTPNLPFLCLPQSSRSAVTFCLSPFQSTLFLTLSLAFLILRSDIHHHSHIHPHTIIG